MNDEQADVLTPWYSPARGLRLVWSVWADPVWYWQHVGPRLDGRKPRLAAALQAAVGIFLVTLVLAAVTGGVAAAARVPVTWGLLGLVPLGAALAGLAIGAFSGLVLSVAIWGFNCGLALSLAAATPRGEPWPPALGLLLYVVAAFSGGVLAGVDWGKRLSVRSVLPVAAILGLLLFASYGWAASLAGAILAAVALVLGARWATRQVADDETREALARRAHPNLVVRNDLARGLQAGLVAEPTDGWPVAPYIRLDTLEEVADGQDHKADQDQPERRVGKDQVGIDDLENQSDHGQ